MTLSRDSLMAMASEALSEKLFSALDGKTVINLEELRDALNSSCVRLFGQTWADNFEVQVKLCEDSRHIEYKILEKPVIKISGKISF